MRKGASIFFISAGVNPQPDRTRLPLSRMGLFAGLLRSVTKNPGDLLFTGIDQLVVLVADTGE